jgi:uncharacterized protein YggT (Ycf19 family)
MPSASFLSYWYLSVPSLLLAALIYLLVGRLILAPFLRADNPIKRVLSAVTDPVVKTVGAVTPRVVPCTGVILFAIMWLLSARILLHQAFLVRRMLG